jgi:multicomponent Na+:H+ antiporter subunit C
MMWLLAITAGVVVAVGAFLATSRDVFRAVIGLAILGSAANLVLFASGRLDSSLPAVVIAGESGLHDAANPLPQALVLTAIVIGFALICFALALVLRLIQHVGTDDALALRQAEPVASDAVKPPLPDPVLQPVWPPMAVPRAKNGEPA